MPASASTGPKIWATFNASESRYATCYGTGNDCNALRGVAGEPIEALARSVAATSKSMHHYPPGPPTCWTPLPHGGKASTGNTVSEPYTAGARFVLAWVRTVLTGLFLVCGPATAAGNSSGQSLALLEPFGNPLDTVLKALNAPYKPLASTSDGPSRSVAETQPVSIRMQRACD